LGREEWTKRIGCHMHTQLKTSGGNRNRGKAGKTRKAQQIHCLGDLNSNIPDVAGSTTA